MTTSIISERDRATIRTLFEEGIAGDVAIRLFTERPSALFLPGRVPCEYCEDTRQLLSEVAELHESISLEVIQFREEPDRARKLGIDRIPAFVLEGANRGKVRFFGVPSGYEFAALLHDLVDASRGTTPLSEETRRALGELSEDVHIQVFSTPT